MMHRLTDGQLTYLENEMAVHSELSAIHKGYEWFQARKVFVTEIMEGNTVYGALNAGGNVYAVMLDTDEYSFSTCTCPEKRNCEHMPAVLFQYADSAGEDPAAMYERLCSERDGMDSEKKGTGEAALNSSKLGGAPDFASGPQPWREWLETRYGAMWKQCKHSLTPLQSVLQELKGKSRGWPKEEQRLHWLLMVIHILKQVEKAYTITDSYNRYYYEISFSRTVDPWIGHLNELMTELRPASLDRIEGKWLEAILLELRSMSLREESTLLRWDYMYNTLLEQSAASADIRRREAEVLRLALEELAGSDKRLGSIWASLAHLSFLEGDDEAALAAIAQTPFEQMSLLVYSFAEKRLESANVSSLTSWMQYIRERLMGSRNYGTLRPFLKLCREADELEEGRNPLWIDTISSFLPYSYPDLSVHYFGRRQWDSWSDLQLFMGIKPDELDAQDLREVTKSAPSMLIPLYHQAIDESVGARNRQGYRTAVKWLKQLNKLYLDAGKPLVWQRYMRELSLKHARLRAFQEELRKGKLV